MNGVQHLRVRFDVARAPLLHRDRDNALWPRRLTVTLRRLDDQAWEVHYVVVSGFWATSASESAPAVTYPADRLHRAPGWVCLLTTDARELAEDITTTPEGHGRTRRVSDPHPVLVGGVVHVSSGFEHHEPTIS